jgi:hypothetical protein
MIGRRPDGWSWIRNFHICWTRVRTKLIVVRTYVFELRFLPYVWARPDGNSRRPDGCSNLPINDFGKKIGSWSITGRRPDGLLSHPGGCKLAQKLLDTMKGLDRNTRRSDGWCLIYLASERYGTSSGRMEQWTDERSDGMARSFWRLTGNRKSFDLQAVQNLLKHFWIAESLLNNIFTYKWFCPTEWGQLQTNNKNRRKRQKGSKGEDRIKTWESWRVESSTTEYWGRRSQAAQWWCRGDEWEPRRPAMASWLVGLVEICSSSFLDFSLECHS